MKEHDINMDEALSGKQFDNHEPRKECALRYIEPPKRNITNNVRELLRILTLWL